MSATKTAARNALLRLTNPRLLRQVSRRTQRPIKRILVIRPDHLGDLLFATPALQHIREAFPDAHITGLVAPWGRPMWQGNSDLDALKVLPFPGMGSKGGGLLAPYLLLRQKATELERENYDLGITLRFDHWWGAALMSAARIPHRWGYDTPGMAEWLTNAVPYTPRKHEVEQNLALVEAMQSSIVGARHASPPPPDRARGLPTLRPPQAEPPDPSITAGWLEAHRRAIIHPGTMAANKLWTIEGWTEVANNLTSDGWAVALTGSPEEKPLADAIASRLRIPHLRPSSSAFRNLAGLTANLSQLTWLLDQANIVLGVDNGPLHIADALGKPTLHLYGPSDETIWGPWGDLQKHRALRAPGTHPSGHLEVGSTDLEGGPEMRAITPEMALGEIALLKEFVP